MITAKLRHLHIAPRKVRLIADLVRGKSAKDARAILYFTIKKAAEPILKLLNSALANAKNNFQLDTDNLYISKITVDEGPKIKRWRARARGSANEIQKKTSHINLVLDEIKKSKIAEKAEKIQKPTEPVKAKEIEKSPIIKKRELRIGAKKPTVSKVIKKIFRRQVF